MAKKVMITETILRDAHQSQAATRMRLEDMLPAFPRRKARRTIPATSCGCTPWAPTWPALSVPQLLQAYSSLCSHNPCIDVSMNLPSFKEGEGRFAYPL